MVLFDSEVSANICPSKRNNGVHLSRYHGAWLLSGPCPLQDMLSFLVPRKFGSARPSLPSTLIAVTFNGN